MHKLVFLFAVLAIKGSHGETSLGKCTDVAPMPGFNMNRLLGYWYAIQTTSNPSACLSYNIVKDIENEGHYKITEIEQHSTIWASALHHEHNVTGDLTVPDENEPGRMDLDLPLDIGTSVFTVFLTDYDNYAAIFICKKYPLIHQWSANILSRTPHLDMAFVDKIRTRLSSYNIDPFNLQIISQKQCPKPGSKGSIVKTTSNIATGVRDKVSNVVSNVGDVINTLASDPQAQNVAEKTSNVASNIGERINGLTSNLGETVSGAVNNVRQKTSDVMGNIGGKVSETVDNVRDGASNIINDVEGRINGLTSKDNADRIGERISGVIDDVEKQIDSINSANRGQRQAVPSLMHGA